MTELMASEPEVTPLIIDHDEDCRLMILRVPMNVIVEFLTAQTALPHGVTIPTYSIPHGSRVVKWHYDHMSNSMMAQLQNPAFDVSPPGELIPTIDSGRVVYEYHELKPKGDR